ncbi:MAG: flippase-like domain-containing protein, partial [Planctomycetes bacterium]|nr:flippase-like domain-containing protein [Planctomycetota bacterium]
SDSPSVGPWRARVIFAAKLAVAAGLLAWLVASGRLDFAQLRNAKNFGLLALAAVTLLASMVLPVWRWKWLLEVQQLTVGWMAAVRMTWLGYFAGLFLPGAAGGDLAKAYAACRHQPAAKMRAVSTVLLDRIIGLHSMLVIGSLAGLGVVASGCTKGQAALVGSVLLMTAVGTAGLFLMFWQPSAGVVLRLVPGRFRQAFSGSVGLYRLAWRRLVWIWLFSGLCTLAAIASYILVAAALGMTASVGQVLVVPLVIVANSLPVSPGGLGVGETVGSQVYMEFGLTSGGVIVLLLRLGVVAFSVPGAVAVVGRIRGNKTAH